MKTTISIFSCFLLLSLLSGCGREVAQENQQALSRPLTAWDSEAGELLARMTLDEKIGQMTQADQQFLQDEKDIEDYFLGSVLSGGDSDPPDNSFGSWTEMYDRYQSRALKTRLAIPLLYGVDAVHGHNNVIGAVVFPHNIGLGATRNAKLVEEISRITAIEVKATGINWTFAPCVAVPRDVRWGRTYEGFGEDPELARVLGEAAVRGLQGASLGDPLSVVACAKHYLADGGTTWGTGMLLPGSERRGADRGDTQLDEPTLRRLHLPGYLSTINAGVATIMPSYSSWNGEKLSGHQYLLTKMLKEELGFDGFLISDYDAIDELPGELREDIKSSINAGMDMVMVPQKYREFFGTLKDLVEKGEVPLERIDDAVTRILRVKYAAGLFTRSPLADKSLAAKFGSEEHRAVARRAVSESIVLLKNEGGLLPLSKTVSRIHVAGKSADDLGTQCGGWTIKWQGESGAITTGTTILQAIKASVSPETELTYSLDGTGAEGAAVAIAVIGEGPYAEMQGDREDLSLSQEDLQTLENLRKAGAPVVAVLISGRPLIVEPVLESLQALLAAWLPGTEGAGVSDVIFGDFHPTGRLPVSWPRSMEQIPVNVGDEEYNPLFEYGFGLSY